ncbi:MAG TPA: hypothetical protein VF681_16050 [Abditibacteriaceae bacterium]|jgi:hypothetical protein
MYRRALRFAAASAFTAAVLLSGSPIFAADSSPLPVSLAPTQPVPADVKISLHFLTDAVAAGAFPTLAHQAEFEVRAVDGKGKPRSGVEVDLPVVIKGGKGPKEAIAARAVWAASSARPRHTTALTDKNGIARGIFTSGNRADELVVLQVPGTESTAQIKQVWEEYGKFEDVNVSGVNIFARYKMFLVRNDIGPDGKPARVSLPVTGHPMTLILTQFTVGSTNMALGDDLNRDGKPDGVYQKRTLSMNDADLTEWKHLHQFIEISKVTEVEPGVYEGTIQFKPPKNEEGEQIYFFTERKYRIVDDSGFTPD